MHYNVVITTPGNAMVAGYVKSLTATVAALNAQNISWYFQSESSSLVTNAREATITGSTNLNITDNSPGSNTYTYDVLFLIDSDIVWTPADFLKLYNSKHMVISGVYFNATGTATTIFEKPTVQRMMTRQELDAKSTVFECAGVGLGFVAVKSGVFETLDRPWFKLGSFAQTINNKTYHLPVGEDLDWCNRVRLKNKIYVDPTVRVGHVKSNTIY